MKKLNNEELQNVSAGTEGYDHPTFEEATALILAHGGRCKHCGTPVQEMVPSVIWDRPWGYIYSYECKCPYCWPATYSLDTKVLEVNTYEIVL